MDIQFGTARHGHHSSATVGEMLGERTADVFVIDQSHRERLLISTG